MTAAWPTPTLQSAVVYSMSVWPILILSAHPLYLNISIDLFLTNELLSDKIIDRL